MTKPALVTIEKTVPAPEMPEAPYDSHAANIQTILDEIKKLVVTLRERRIVRRGKTSNTTFNISFEPNNKYLQSICVEFVVRPNQKKQ